MWIGRKQRLVVVGVEQGELLVAVDPVLGIVDVEHDPPRHLTAKLSQNSSIMAIHHALEGGPAPAGSPAGTWSAASTGRRHSRAAGQTAILNAGSTRSASQSLASS